MYARRLSSSSTSSLTPLRQRSSKWSQAVNALHYVPSRLACRSKSNLLGSIRAVSSIPISQGSSQVQHVRLAPPNRKWLGGSWSRRTLYFVLAIQFFAWYGKRYGKSKDVPESEQEIGTVESVTQDKGTSPDTEAASKQTEGEMVIEVESDDVWFLPYGWPKKKKPVYYKGSGEDWTEFHKLSSSREKISEVKGMAASYIELVAKRTTACSKLLGEPIRCTKHWLDIDYPLGYSNGYEVDGLLITNDFLAIARRDFDEQTILRFFRIVSPVALMNAFWDVTKTVFGGKEGFATKTKENEKFPIGIPGFPDLSATPVLGKVVKEHSMKLRRPQSTGTIPRGCVMVSGRIDVTGTRHWATFHFLGFFDPKHDAWVGAPRIEISKIRPLKLAPRG